MMSHPFRTLLGVLLVTTTGAHAVEIKQWDRLPIAVPLVVGQERIIFVDQDVRVGVPSAIAAQLRVQSIGGTVYLRPSDLISPTRLQLQSISSGEIILLDIDAQPGEHALEPIQIATKPSATGSGESEQPERHTQRTPVPVALTRYAAQNLYAPLRTVESLPGVHRMALKVPTDLRRLLPTEHVAIEPMAAWRLDDFWVTAVKIRNLSTQIIDLDPRKLQATLFGAAFQHPTLGLSGTTEDTTVAYLVTRDGGLEQALLLPAAQSVGGDHEG
jgi:integrating conjugative element protein (TIGR03749 family)